MQLELRLQELVDVVKELSQPIVTHFGQDVEWITKTDGTPASPQVDIKINNEFRDWCARRGDIGFVGEEGSGIEPDQYDYILNLDPLDGTKAFKRDNNTCSTVASIMERGSDGLWRPVMGVIFGPLINFLSAAERGSGTIIEDSKQQKQGKVRDIHQEKYDVYVCSWPGVPFHLDHVRQHIEDSVRFSQQRSRGTAVAGGRVAAGTLDACIFAGKSATETAAMQLVVEESGGCACNLSGNMLDGYQLVVRDDDSFDFELPRGAIVASNQQLAKELSDIVMSHN